MKMGRILISMAVLGGAVALARVAQAERGLDGVMNLINAARRGGLAVPENAAAVPVDGAEAGPSVSITSFLMDGQNTRAAEICGRVTGGGAGFTVVRVTVDPGSKAPGVYNTLAGADGAYCLKVSTFYGRASASASLLNKEAASKVASASRGDSRN